MALYKGMELDDSLIGLLRHKAQVAVDTMIRNLFERTADIGFPATDKAVILLTLPGTGEVLTPALLAADEPNSDLLVLLSAKRIRQRFTKQGVIARIDQEYEPGMA